MNIGSICHECGTRLLITVFAVAGLLTIDAPAIAQTDQLVLEEITVTARKVEENILDVPIAVSPFTAQKIRDLQLKSTDDVALFTPGLSFTSAFGRQPGSDRPTIRGISTISNGIANASAASYFIDGVYVGGSPQSTELSNLERVEILRGPQAAQFGRGTYLGAINYVTRRPSDVLEGELELSAGTDGLFEGVGWVSGPISEDVLYYVGVGFETIDGQYDNQLPASSGGGGDLGGEETLSFTGKLFWSPNDSVDVTLKLGYQETDDEYFPIYLQSSDLNNTAFRGPAAPRAREYYDGTAKPDEDGIEATTGLLDQFGDSGTELERKIAALTINWDLSPNFTLSSVTGYVDDEVNTGFDISYAGYDPFAAIGQPGIFFQLDEDEQSDFSQEIRLTSTAVQNMRLTLGGYYYKGETEENFSLRIQPCDPADPLDPLESECVPSTFYPFAQTAPLVSTNGEEEIENWAIFGAADWDISDRITLGFEFRYAEDEVSSKEVPVDGSPVTTDLNETFDSFTPRLTAVYRFSDGVNVYGNVAKGTKPGAFNTECPELPEAVDEEEAWNYELGLKSNVWDGRANFNVAGYFVTVDDQQVTTVCEIPSLGTTTSALTNAGETEVWGIELESTVLLSENLTAGLTYAWTDAEITEEINVDQADLNGSLGGAAETILNGDVSGNDVFRVPDHQFSLFARYERPFGADNSWYITGDWAYEASKYSQVHNLIETGDRNIVGLRAGVIWGQWELEVWGRNIFDEDTPVDILRYIDRRPNASHPTGSLPSCFAQGTAVSCTEPTFASSSPRGFGLTLPQQRLWGATVRFRFGG